MEKPLKEKPLSREEARKLLQSIDYKTLSGFEEYVENYKGPFKNYLLKVVDYLIEQSRKGNRIFRLGDSEIEQILNATFPKCK